MAVVVEARTDGAPKQRDAQEAADVFVAFGITVDLAKHLLAGVGRWHGPWVAS